MKAVCDTLADLIEAIEDRTGRSPGPKARDIAQQGKWVLGARGYKWDGTKFIRPDRPTAPTDSGVF